ncbi:MAG: hypothetical protein U9P12_00010 [Verrucomicrobiota bacterium]|nr:hypothetical protein [Verrucomicrobiota bacterium]
MMKNRLKIILATGLCMMAFLFPASAKKKAKPRPYQSLVDNSPFLTPAFRARLGERDTVALNFIGYTRIGEEWFFAVHNRKSGQALWLKMGVEQDGIKIEKFDEETQTIHLVVGGIGFDLVLEKESK